MSTFVLVLRELIGLFIDDGSLAIAIVAVVLLAALSAAAGGPALVTGGILFAGCLVALGENIRRTTRRTGR
jgi:hypothetical protein